MKILLNWLSDYIETGLGADPVRGPKGKGSNGADTASRSRSQPKVEDNLFTSPKGIAGTMPPGCQIYRI